MPIKAKKRFIAVSLSRLKDYELCPYRAMQIHINGLKDKQGPAMARGAGIHNQADLWLKKKLAQLAPELKLFKKEFATLRANLIGSEIKWGFTARWEPLDDWFHPSTWLRVVADAMQRIQIRKRPAIDIIDFKTGQHRPAKVVEYKDQLKLYAPATFMRFPEIDRIRGSLWFTDAGEIEKEEYTRDQLPELIAHWNGRFKPMMHDTRFVPKPSDFCGHCHLSKRNGGPCRF